MGATASEWTDLGAILPSPGCYGETLYLYLARGLQCGDVCPDEDEFLECEWMPFAELYRLCMDGTVQDGKTVTAVLKVKLLLGL